MKISKYLKVHRKVKFSMATKNDILQGNYPKKLYFLCTGKNNIKTFEIIKGNFLNQSYKECYLLGLAKTREDLLEYLIDIVDNIYVKKTLSFEQLEKKEKIS